MKNKIYWLIAFMVFAALANSCSSETEYPTRRELEDHILARITALSTGVASGIKICQGTPCTTNQLDSLTTMNETAIELSNILEYSCTPKNHKK